MYIPGRRRTGSRPSRTVMSFAVYAASAIKKALQIAILRGLPSVSEVAVGPGLDQARSSRPRDELAELRIVDLRSGRGGRGLDLGRYGDRRIVLGRRVFDGRRRLWNRAHCEPHCRRRGVGESRTQSVEDRVLEEV